MGSKVPSGAQQQTMLVANVNDIRQLLFPLIASTYVRFSITGVVDKLIKSSALEKQGRAGGVLSGPDTRSVSKVPADPQQKGGH